MNYPYALSLFLPDGMAEGLKIIEKSNWNGKGFSCSKKVLFEKHRNRREFESPGIYFLIGEDEKDPLSKRLYIGEGDPVIRRLEDHYRNKEWWTECIIFTGVDQNVNKAFVQYFESQLVKLAIKTTRYRIENGNTPDAPLLSERDLAICEGFLREILLCLPLLGINLEPYKTFTNDSEILYIRRKGIVASGCETIDGFLILKDSEIANQETNSIPKSIQLLRRGLMEEGIIKEYTKGTLRFTADHRFGSPSTASSVILGASTNGRDVWENEKGITLKAIQLQRLTMIDVRPS